MNIKIGTTQGSAVSILSPRDYAAQTKNEKLIYIIGIRQILSDAVS